MTRKNPKYEKKLEKIKEYMEEHHNSRNWVHYTDHGPQHSDNIIGHCEALLADTKINPAERYILYASAYIHDIGMSDKAAYKKVEPDSPQFNIRRKNHAINGFNFIQKDRDLSEIIDDDNALQHIAQITKYHSGNPRGFFDTLFVTSGRTVDGLPIRRDLLSGLIRLGDELDLGYKRVDFKKIQNTKMRPFGLFEFYRNHYISDVSIQNGIITIHFDFHPNIRTSKEIKDFFISNTLLKIKKEIELIDNKELFWNNNVKLKVGKYTETFNSNKEFLPSDIEAYIKAEYYKSLFPKNHFCFDNISAPFLLLSGVYSADDTSLQWGKEDVVTKYNQGTFALSNELANDYNQIIEIIEQNAMAQD